MMISTLDQEITYELAQKFTTAPQEQPVLILFGGYQGSGKSTLIARLQAVYNANVISTDAVRQSLFDRNIAPTSPCVSNIFQALFKECLALNTHIFIDANAHSRRIAEIEKLLTNPAYKVIKIFLKASEETLRERVQNRPLVEGCYQGTLSDLEATLKIIKMRAEDYDIIVETDNLSKAEVFDSIQGML